jgi:hypothetical protein
MFRAEICVWDLPHPPRRYFWSCGEKDSFNREREDEKKRERETEEREWRGNSRFISRRSSPLTASSSVE